LKYKRDHNIRQEKARLLSLKKIAQKQKSEGTKFDENGKEILKVNLEDVEKQIVHIEDLEEQK